MVHPEVVIEKLRIQDEKREDELLALKDENRELKLVGTREEVKIYYAMKQRAEAAGARVAKLEAAGRWLGIVLPMAMGYAAQHPVGSNADYIEEAEAALDALKEE